MTCSNCHKETIDGKFCAHCGNPTNHKAHKEESTGSVDQYFSNKRTDLISGARASANQAMIQGIVYFFGGLLITGATYLFAEPGGTYFITWGAMIWGIYALIRGLYYRAYPEKLLINPSKDGKK